MDQFIALSTCSTKYYACLKFKYHHHYTIIVTPVIMIEVFNKIRFKKNTIIIYFILPNNYTKIII